MSAKRIRVSRLRRICARGLIMLAALCVAPTQGIAQPPAADPTAPSPPPVASATPESVMASLNRTLGWYRQAQLVVRSLDGTGVVSRADEQTAFRLVQRAFDVARGQAAVLARDKAAGSP